VDDLRTAIDHGTGPRTVGEFITDLAECMVHRIADVVEDIDDWADRLEEDVLTGERHRIRSELADVRRQAIELRRYLAPQREALGHLQVERVPWLGDLERLQIREVGDRTTRLIEDLDSARERAAVTHEELLSRISEQVERRTYILTMIATIFLPLTFLTGLLGINVSGIPFSEKPWGFALVVALLAVLGGNLWWVLKRKHWW
jgi:zinc transporter